jgi:hypothetical protein
MARGYGWPNSKDQLLTPLNAALMLAALVAVKLAAHTWNDENVKALHQSRKTMSHAVAEVLPNSSFLLLPVVAIAIFSLDLTSPDLTPALHSPRRDGRAKWCRVVRNNLP